MLKTRLRRSRSSESGDTIIEVLFAITVFSMVAVGALTLMNQGVSASQRSLEVTLVRQQIDAQAEALRFMHQSYITAYHGGGATVPVGVTPDGQYATILTQAKVTSATSFDTGPTCPAYVPKSFVIDTRTARVYSKTTGLGVSSLNFVQDPATYAKITYNPDDTISSSEGVWVEAVGSPVQTDASGRKVAGYVDYHIRACWYSPGQNHPMNLGTIVRLYEPRI